MQSFLFWGTSWLLLPFVHHFLPLLALALIFGEGLVVKLLLFLTFVVALLVEVDHCCLAYPFLLPVQISRKGLDIRDNLLGLHLRQTPHDILLAVLHLNEDLPIPLVDVIGLVVINFNEVLTNLLDDFHPLPLDVFLLLDF